MAAKRDQKWSRYKGHCNACPNVLYSTLGTIFNEISYRSLFFIHTTQQISTAAEDIRISPFLAHTE
jgi:hypothetical protein